MKDKLAPIGISTYIRLEHLKRTIESLVQSPLAFDSELYVFSDAARSGDEEKVDSIRGYLRTVEGFKSINIVERTENNRVANSRGGLTQLLDAYGSVIFMPEDTVVAPGFLAFMNEGLERYKCNQKIFSIAGYTPPICIPKNYPYDVFFLRRFCAWGFATWKDRFSQIKYMSSYQYNKFSENKHEVREFVEGGGVDMMYMLRKDAYGEIDAGDVKAMYAQYVSDQYTVYPVHSLVKNIGFDGTGEHCKPSSSFDVAMWDKKEKFLFEDNVVVNPDILREHNKFRAKQHRSKMASIYARKCGLYTFLKKIKNIFTS